jgi:predicted RNA methylase
MTNNLLLISVEITLAIFLLFLLWLAYTRFRGAEYSPTTKIRAKKMFEFANISRRDIVYDLGSGFGGLVIQAAEKAKKVRGIEYDYLRYLISKLRASFRKTKNIKFIRGDFFKERIDDANVVFLFLKQNTNQKLKEKLKKLRKGTRIVSNRWTFENWKPIKKDDQNKVYLYVIGISDNVYKTK